MPWLELTLDIEAALAEDLSDALLAEGAQSVWIGGAEGEHRVLGALLPASVDPRALLARASAAAGAPRAAEPRVRRVEDRDWVRETQSQFEPIRVADRLWVVPTWHEPPAEGIAIRLDPGLAFGTGSHPTTRLVLAWVAALGTAGRRVLDYGCGSGILAIAAAKLGAARVDAVDIDPEALAATSTNARANGIEVHAFEPERLPPGAYDIVVANILAQPLIVLAPLLAARTRARGRLALAGILAEQAADVAGAYEADFDIHVSAHGEGWVLLEGTRR